MRRCWCWLVLVALVSVEGASARDDGDWSSALKPLAFDDFLVVPLRVHVLQSERVPDAHCGLDDETIARIMRKVNVVWGQAGVYFGVESSVREPAAREAEFLEHPELPFDGAIPLRHFLLLMPDESREPGLLHVYFIREFSVNGVYLGDGLIVVKETASLRPVAGGIDEPLPRVTAHELGHALGLAHRQATTNLLASGTTGVLLNEAEIARARAHAAARGAWTTAELARMAEQAGESGDEVAAQRYRKWLSQIPGRAGAAAEADDALEETPVSTRSDGPPPSRRRR